MSSQGDYIAFADLVLNGEGSIRPDGAAYTILSATGLAAPPTPRVTTARLAARRGMIISEVTVDKRVITLAGELSALSHEDLEAELFRFAALLDAALGEQWFYWTPLDGTARRISAVLQNNAGAILDVGGDASATFQLELLCADPYYEALTVTTTTADLTGTGDELSITHLGSTYTEPVITIKPTSAKSGGYSYKRWLAMWNQSGLQLSTYPVQISSQAGISGIDHAALVTAGKLQADGDDLRVEVDGVEVDRWLDGENTNSCKVWVNLTMGVGADTLLDETFGGGDTLSSLTVDDVTGFPASGVLYNVTTGEAFTYTARDDALQRFTGLVRAVKGTSAANGAVGNKIVWIEHDIWLKYGNATATAPSVDDDYEPAFELDLSSNLTWVYEEFGEDDGLRAAQWQRQPLRHTPTFYGGNRGATADPWQEMGARSAEVARINIEGRYYLNNPCRILTANFTNGESYYHWYVDLLMLIQSRTATGGWVQEYEIARGAADTWNSWSRNETLETGSVFVGLYLEGREGGTEQFLEVADVTVTLDSTRTPAIVYGDEQAVYDLDCTLTMIRDSVDYEAIGLALTMALNQTLEIDCEERTVTLLDDGSNQFQALTLLSPAVRTYWMKLEGDWDGGQVSSIRYDETGMAAVTLTSEHYVRYV